MEKNKKLGFKWRGLATFLLSLGMLVEIVSGVVLYITPPGRYANWNNWTLWGLTKGEWGAIHTIFGYLLLIIIGLHLYFNWRVIAHFFWSKMKNTFNLKKELAVSAVVTVFIFTGTLWGIPPFSTIMDLGEDAKLSWEANSGVASFPGYGRAATLAHDARDGIIEQAGRGRGASTSGWNAEGSIAQNQPVGEYFASGRGRGRSVVSQVAPQIEQVSYTARGGGFGRKTVEIVCSENNMSSQTGLARLHDNGINANARDYTRDLANRSGKRPSEIIQIIREGRITSTYTGERVDLNLKTSETLKGRDYVNLGKLGTISGVLVQMGDEWGLNAKGIIYVIHLGPGDFRASKGFVLKHGTAATVKGFIHGTDLSVTVIETEGQTIVLRDETGRPAWGGSKFSRRDIGNLGRP